MTLEVADQKETGESWYEAGTTAFESDYPEAGWSQEDDDSEWLDTWDQDAAAAMREADAALEEAVEGYDADREAHAAMIEASEEHGAGHRLDALEARANRAYAEEPW